MHLRLFLFNKTLNKMFLILSQFGQVMDSSLAGQDPVITAEDVPNHIFYDPIPGDMLATIEAKPQVRLSFHGISSR